MINHNIKIMDSRTKAKIYQQNNIELLVEYIDYLEGVARDFHLHARLIANAVGGDIPDRGIWKVNHDQR
jgi:hypothetical protein